MIKAILFDLDGTLVNSLEDLAVATNTALKLNGYKTHKISEYKYFVGDGIPKMIERALPEESRNLQTIEKIKNDFFCYYSVHYADNTYAYDGIKEILIKLKNEGIKIAVVSNKAQQMAEFVVKKIYGDVFDVISGKVDGIPSKPNPAAAINVMNVLEVKPDECVFVGDSGVDAATAVNSGAVPVGVLWGFREARELTENGAKYLLKRPQELIEIMEKLNER